MLFSEIYGSYFRAVAAVLTRAAEGNLSSRELTDIVQSCAFGESLLRIPAALKEQRWPLLSADLHTPLAAPPSMPLSTLERQWLKALLQDPRIRLFSPSEEGLEDVEPLYEPGTFVFYDRCTDGDPFGDESYIEHFQTALRAIREKRRIRVAFADHKGQPRCHDCVPCRLEYSAKDDRFRLLGSHRGGVLTINMARIRAIRLLEPCAAGELPPVSYRERELCMELRDERNALERVMLQFSDLEKETEKIGEGRFRVRLWYKQADETEILIRILSFGPVLRVTEPASLVNQIRTRLEKQQQLLEKREETADA